jgi:chromatin remodeling complex protein RSC6
MESIYRHNIILPILDDIDNLKKQQEELNKIVSDKDETVAALKQIQSLINGIINKNKDIVSNSEDDDLDDLEEQDDNLEEQEDDLEEDDDLEEEDDELKETKILVPIQNHITFTHSNETNYNVDKGKYLLSNQLCKFLKIEKGTITKNYMNECEKVIKYIKKNGLQDIHNNQFNLDLSLRKLFGITENEDYELTPQNISHFLKPHFRQI